MRHAVVHDPPAWGKKAIIIGLLKLTALALFLVAVLAFPARPQTVYPPPMPLLRESNPVAIMQLEANRAMYDSVSRQGTIRGSRRLADVRIPVLRLVEIHDTMSMAIHFDGGSATIRPDAFAALESKLDLLRGIPTMRIRIEGQADARGSSSSNITLAWSRAEAAKLWLTSRGIASDRIDAVGFSSSRPICEDRQESCLWQNRRAEFVIVAGVGSDVPRSQ